MGVSKNLCDVEHNSFCLNEVAMSGVFFKIVFVADLLVSQCFFEILQTSLNVKNSENVAKSGCFEKRLQWRPLILFYFILFYFFEMKKRYKVFYVKILIFR